MEWRYWSLGAALFSHAVAFIGVTYFDQTIVAWYVLLAMIAAITSVRKANLAHEVGGVPISTANIFQTPALISNPNYRVKQGRFRSVLEGR